MQQEKETSNIQNKKRPKNSGSKAKHSRLYIAGVLLGAAIILYLLIGSSYRNVFFPRTIVNGVNVSGLHPSEALEAMNTATGEYVLTLTEDGENTESISGGSIDLRMTDDSALQAILNSQNMLTWGLEGFRDKNYSLNIDFDEEKLRETVDSFSCMDQSKWISPKSAYITYEKGTGYQIIPETTGNEILVDALFEVVSKAVCNLDKNLSLADADIYKLPEISSEDPSLQEQLTLLQSYSDMTVTYQFGSQTEVLDSDTISEWISVSGSGRRRIDREAVAEYVKGLAKRHNTSYAPKTLDTSYGETVTIKNGYYGWLIDKEAEVDALMAILREGKSVTREPIYSMEAASHDGPDYGDTYVEINLTAQHLFYYKNGELVIESDFVSGNPSRGNETPGGAFSITYTERNATLKGQNYRTPVSYWMPFNGNIGMHDSSWRSTYGGSIYKTNGSHGCINLPPAAAKTIFENIEKGIPVLCYHLSGTEQAHATNLSGNQVVTPPAVPETEPEIPLLPDATVSPDGQVLPDGTIPTDGQVLPEGVIAPDGQVSPEVAPDVQPVPGT